MGGASSSGSAFSPGHHMNLLNSSSGFGGNSGMNNPSSIQGYINPAGGEDSMAISSSGGMGMPAHSAPNTLASFVGGPANNSNVPGIDLTSMATKHQRMGSGNPHSMANLQPVSSAAMASMSSPMSSASHAMATTSGQSETAA